MSLDYIWVGREEINWNWCIICFIKWYVVPCYSKSDKLKSSTSTPVLQTKVQQYHLLWPINLWSLLSTGWHLRMHVAHHLETYRFLMVNHTCRSNSLSRKYQNSHISIWWTEKMLLWWYFSDTKELQDIWKRTNSLFLLCLEKIPLVPIRTGGKHVGWDQGLWQGWCSGIEDKEPLGFNR